MNGIEAAWQTARTEKRASARLVVMALAHIGHEATPGEVVATTGLGWGLVEATLRQLAKDHDVIVRRAWLDDTEHKQVAYRFDNGDCGSTPEAGDVDGDGG